jgi:hypothetical protein
MAGLGVVLDTNVLLSGLAYPASVPGRAEHQELGQTPTLTPLL